MDRTNWQFGRKDINFLVVSVVAGAVAVPLFWKVLPKKTKRGNSNTRQRIALINRLLSALPVKDIFVLTMDREFVGKQWLKYLDDKGIAFIARIKVDIQIDGQRADVLAAKILAKHRQDAGRCQSYGLDLFFACKNITCIGARDTKLLVLSNRFRGKQALDIYRKRWGIERLFWHLKKKGFDLEATHMTCPKKLDKLFAVLALAFIVSFAWGCQLRHSKQRQTKQSMRKSLFRLGLEDILRMCQQMHSNGLSQRQRARKEIAAFKRWIFSENFAAIFLV